MDAGCLITLCYFQNTSPSIISNLVLYWGENNILDRVNLIQSGINLKYITKPSRIQSKETITTYYKKQDISQVRKRKR